MKKTYYQPQMEITFAEVTNMLAESLLISKGSVDGNETLVKWSCWDIWGEEEDF